ncbi:MAG: VWA domain-containing protein [Selenomonadaceae bacterium]|nr:VWA domain-containing protein [Selenomonadaceae bacterium]
MKKMRFPFSAVVGQEKAKEALLLALINPRLAGVLLSGAGGTAKTLLVRAAEDFSPDGRIVELPIGATEDMVFGSIDMEAALTEGRKRHMPGILQKADGSVLYMDEVNLLRRDFLRTVLDSAAQGSYSLERDGISYTSPTRFIPIGTMAPDEGLLDGAILDSFGLFASLDEPVTAEQRVEIVRRVLEYEADPDAFAAKWEEQDNKLAEQVQKARELLPEVELSEAMLLLIAEFAARAYCRGNRAELYLAEAARAAAALAGRSYVMPKDVEKAALYALPHRMGTPPQELPPEEEQQPVEQEPAPQDVTEDNNEPPTDEPADMGNDSNDLDNQPLEEQAQNEQPPENPPESNPDGLAPEEDIVRVFKTLEGMKIDMGRTTRKAGGTGSGKQNTVRTREKQGRYVKSEMNSRSKELDLAFDATVRAAAPFQRLRRAQENSARALIIRPEDYRQRVREKRTGINLLFVVDASGSMGAKKRMGIVKGVIMGLLQQAYQKRNRVGLIAFRRDTAEVMLPVTRSVDLAEKLLRELPTGGKTPLAEALECVSGQLYGLEHQQEQQETVVILLTDGRTSAQYKGDDPVQRVMEQAERLSTANASFVIIDTESGYLRLGIARKLAQLLNGAYYTLPKLSEDKLLKILTSVQ